MQPGPLCTAFAQASAEESAVLRGPNADKCLAAVAAKPGTCDDFEAECSFEAFAPASGTAAIGEPCGGSITCAACTNAIVNCEEQEVDSVLLRRCIANILVNEGAVCDAPDIGLTVQRSCGVKADCDVPKGAKTGICKTTGDYPPACLTSVPPDVTDFVVAYATAQCAAFGPCCGASGYAPGGATCRQRLIALTRLAYTGSFDAARASACLDELKTVGACVEEDPIFFVFPKQNRDIPASTCARVFDPPKKAAGEPCVTTTDCLAPEGGAASCFGGTCHALTVGKAGDVCSPSVPAVDLPATSALCQPKDGLFCDPTSKVCTPKAALGQPCAGPGVCQTSVCSKGVCSLPPEDGAACTNDATCGPDKRCDPQSKTCGPFPANGAACTKASDCVRGTCVNGACRTERGWLGRQTCL